jgi:hypothetical protein
MTAHAIEATATRRGPVAAYRARGYLFREAMAAGIGFGLYLHLTGLIFGKDTLRAHLLSPAVDVAFGVLMIYISAAAIAAWRLVEFRGTWQRRIHVIIIGFVTVSIPIHLAALFTHSTAYINALPRWYSMGELGLFAAFIYAETHLRLRTGGASS